MNGMELSCVHSLIRQSIVAQLVWNPQLARWGGGVGGRVKEMCTQMYLHLSTVRWIGEGVVLMDLAFFCKVD